jgi:hypothetical protein
VAVSGTIVHMGVEVRRALWGCVVLATACYRGGDGRGDAEMESSDGADDDGVDDGGADSDDGGDPEDASQSGPTGLRLLTPTQYQNSVIDVLGDVAAPAVGQWRSSLAAAQGGVAAAAVEDYEEAAMFVTAEVFGDPARRMALAGCTPVASADDPCVVSVIETIGLRAWRRPLTAEEVARHAGVAEATAELLGGDPWMGLQHAVAGLLQSPNFVYRVELGTPIVEDDPLHVRLDGYELASRISYLVCTTPPAVVLLAAAGAGELDEAAGIEGQVERLFASPRAREGVVQLFVDMFDLDVLLGLQKDAALLPAFTETVGPAMREELVLVIGDTVIDQRDYRRLFDTTQGYVDAELAALYGVEGTFGSDFTPVMLPAPRGGLLTLAGFLAINSGEASTSPTKRGLTVRKVVMCQNIPPPPPDVEAELPEPGEGEEHQTKREQLEQHRNDPTCATCHEFTDPIGLALENYDALGGYRETDQGLAIDPSGTLDGMPFADAAELGALLATHPNTADCVVRNLYRYASGHVEQSQEQPTIDELVAGFSESGYDLTLAIEALAASESFRHATLSEEDAP